MADALQAGNDEAVKLLALDGGGIRGVSELLILDEIMRRVQYDQNLPEIPRPCDYFHLIGGTSTGGLIALMLGRLRMNTTDALQVYNKIARATFSDSNKKRSGQDGSFKATTLANEVKKVVSEADRGEKILDPAGPPDKGKAFVCATPANNMAYPRRFRTYPVRQLQGANCEIWKAARATTAAPTFFKRIAISHPGHAEEEFIDGGLGCNNPANQVLEEARDIFGKERLVSCLVSIGTGHPGVIGLEKPDRFQKILPTKLVTVLKKIATDCEATAQGLSTRFKDIEKFYFRFNVDHGAEGISLEEWEKMGQLTEHTNAYMSNVQISQAIDHVVDILCRPANSGWALGSICGAPLARSEPPPVQMRPKPAPSPIFTGRAEIMHKLDSFFCARAPESLSRREYLLYGLGGVGKTQIALKFAQEFKARFQFVFWVDASSRLTIEQSYKSIGAERSGAEADKNLTAQAILQWLSSLKSEWLLLIDSCENVSIDDLQGLIPSGDAGNILYTSRDRGFALTFGDNACEVSEMESDDAISLLLKSAKQESHTDDTATRQDAQAVVQALGHLPLAIDIAGAFICMGRCRLADYLDMYRKHRQDMMNDSSFKGASRYNQAVYTTWDVSYDALKSMAKQGQSSQRSTDAQAALQILHLSAYLHHNNILEEIFEYAAVNKYLDDDTRAQYSFDYSMPLSQLVVRNEDGTWDPFLFRKGLAMLVSFSMIKQDQNGRAFSMHVLVHLWAHDHTPPHAQLDQSRATMALLSSSIRPRFEKTDYDYRRQLLSHVLACVSSCSTNWEFRPEDRDDLPALALVFDEAGKWNEAERLEVQVVEARKRVLGSDHPDTLTSMSNLASTYRNQGRWEAAEGLEVQVLETCKRVLSADHPETLTSMNNLAYTWKSKGKDIEALQLMKDCVARSSRVLGLGHPRTVSSSEALESWKTSSEDSRETESEEADS